MSFYRVAPEATCDTRQSVTTIYHLVNVYVCVCVRVGVCREMWNRRPEICYISQRWEKRPGKDGILIG